MFDFKYKNIDFAHKLDMASLPTEEYFKHIHSFCEILLFIKGNVNYTVESETRTLNNGDLVCISPGQYHFATVNSDYAYERYVLKFPFDILPEFVKNQIKDGYWINTNGKKYVELFSRYDEYFEHYGEEELYYLFLHEAVKLTILLCHENKESLKIGNNFINRLTDYIEANICKQLTLQSIANEFHYSKSFIAVEFKKYMKIPIMLYIRQKKIVRANIMIQSGVPKQKAARLLGFDTYSTFYRCYNKYLNSIED